ncbi:MAG: dihydrodipicolinate synthase family protein [Bacteroidales bacterium]|nr:dihydrodipicolinate synthase family protein [Bacteroidales bacterium]
MEPDTILRLAREVKNVAAVKEASGNLANIGKILGGRPADFAVLSGDDSLTLPLMALSADGVISTTANVFPRQMVALTRAVQAGEMEKAREIHYKIAGAIRLLFEEGNPAGVKAALHIQGFCENSLRLPLVPVSRNLYGRIEEEIAGIR